MFVAYTPSAVLAKQNEIKITHGIASGDITNNSG